MKRAQLEKIVIAAAGLANACKDAGVGGIQATNSSGDSRFQRVTFHVETDEDLQALAGALGASIETRTTVVGWWLYGVTDFAGIRICLIGPTHIDSAPEPQLDTAKVDAALAQAAAAIAAPANKFPNDSLLCCAAVDDEHTCGRPNGHHGPHAAVLVVYEAPHDSEAFKRAAIVVSPDGTILKDSYGDFRRGAS